MKNTILPFVSLSIMFALGACGGPEETASNDSDLLVDFNPTRLTPLPILARCNVTVDRPVNGTGEGDSVFRAGAEGLANQAAYGDYIVKVVDENDRVICPDNCKIPIISNLQPKKVGPSCAISRRPLPWHCVTRYEGRSRVTCTEKKKIVGPIGRF